MGDDSLEGINIYVSLSVPPDPTSFQTMGRPCGWVGPWDRSSLNQVPKVTG
ncbi:MAG: hypothetical protein P8099_19585 [Gemmatimonadota bacterium]|jgi:hypothetical protein